MASMGYFLLEDKIEYVYGDITKTSIKYICHGVNSLGVMGAGLALQLRNLYPKLYKEYRAKFNDGKLKLGYVFGVDCGKHTIFNIVAQSWLGARNKPLNITALTKRLVTLDKFLPKGTKVAFPLIGCGLAGGNWLEVKELLNALKNISPVVYVLNDEILF